MVVRIPKFVCMFFVNLWYNTPLYMLYVKIQEKYQVIWLHKITKKILTIDADLLDTSMLSSLWLFLSFLEFNLLPRSPFSTCCQGSFLHLFPGFSVFAYFEDSYSPLVSKPSSHSLFLSFPISCYYQYLFPSFPFSFPPSPPVSLLFSN